MNSIIGTVEEAKSLPFNADEWVVDIVSTKAGKTKWEATTVCASVLENKVTFLLCAGLNVVASRGCIDTNLECDLLFGAVVSACNQPGGAQSVQMAAVLGKHPSRPTKLWLATSNSHKKLLKNRFQAELGISTSFASQELFNMIRSFTHKYIQNCLLSSEALASDTIPSVADTIRSLADGQNEVSEVVDLQGWDPRSDPELKHFPFDWFVRCPSAQCSRPSLLWGWRTNLENASRSGDHERLREKCLAHDPVEVKDFCMMRLLLSKAAFNGLFEVCKVLVEVAGVEVDEAYSPNNKRQYRAVQKASDDKGASPPLMKAAFKGYTHIVSWLLSRGANSNLVATRSHMTAIGAAVVNGHKESVILLVQAGADVNSPAGPEGQSAVAVAKEIAEYYSNIDDPRKKNARSILKLLLPGDDGRPSAISRLLTVCGICDAANCTLKCPCKQVYYCSRECQKEAWPLHKITHP